jgi:hypothetical protein
MVAMGVRVLVANNDHDRFAPVTVITQLSNVHWTPGQSSIGVAFAKLPAFSKIIPRTKSPALPRSNATPPSALTKAKCLP